MKSTKLPDSSSRTKVRLLLLLTLLFVVISSVVLIKQIAGKAGESGLRVGFAMTGGRFFQALVGKHPAAQPSDLGLDAIYSQSLLIQLDIAERSAQFYRLHGFPPATVEELALLGLPRNDQLDPWKRSFQIHVYDNMIVVQSTGPNGIDRVFSKNPIRLRFEPGKKFYLVQDNLLVLRKLPELAVGAVPEER